MHLLHLLMHTGSPSGLNLMSFKCKAHNGDLALCIASGKKTLLISLSSLQLPNSHCILVWQWLILQMYQMFGLLKGFVNRERVFPYPPLFIKMHCIAIFLVDICLAQIQKIGQFIWLLAAFVRRPIIHLFIHSFLKTFECLITPLRPNTSNNGDTVDEDPSLCPEGSVQSMFMIPPYWLHEVRPLGSHKKVPALCLFRPSLLPHTLLRKTQQSLKNNPVNCSIQFCL